LLDLGLRDDNSKRRGEKAEELAQLRSVEEQRNGIEMKASLVWN